jgi:cell division protease FtsH
VKRGTRTILIWILLVALATFALLNRSRGDKRPDGYVSIEQSLDMIDEGEVSAYRVRDQGLQLLTSDGQLLAVHPPMSARVSQRLEEARIPFMPESRRSDNTTLIAIIVIPVVLGLAFFYFWRKTNAGQMNNIVELRKSKSRSVADRDKARFADIGGHRQAVDLLADIVDFLQAPQLWMESGTRLPRGILLVGAPGTGKTLLARAVAGETQSAFFYTSAAEFVEMFVGIGAARVRDTFEKAAAQQPAVIFIDELDAIGRRRGSGMGAMHEEREQTLNQLLVLMDGLEHYDQLVVMAATNRPDVLDPALLRSGRFDRVLRLQPPTLVERVEILKIHTRSKRLDTSVSLEQIADQADGFTGADLEALTNDAALLAVRRSRNDTTGNPRSVVLTSDDFARAREAMTTSNRQFNRLDSILVESVSQFAEPTGRVLARVTLTTGNSVEGEVLWMNASHVKLRAADGSEVVVAKDLAERIVPLAGTESTPPGDFTPDRWAGRNLDVG